MLRHASTRHGLAPYSASVPYTAHGTTPGQHHAHHSDVHSTRHGIAPYAGHGVGVSYGLAEPVPVLQQRLWACGAQTPPRHPYGLVAPYAVGQYRTWRSAQMARAL
eukprot:1120730-Rhodomonas_salina.2